MVFGLGYIAQWYSMWKALDWIPSWELVVGYTCDSFAHGLRSLGGSISLGALDKLFKKENQRYVYRKKKDRGSILSVFFFFPGWLLLPIVNCVNSISKALSFIMYDTDNFCNFFNYIMAGHFFHFKLFYFCQCSFARGTVSVAKWNSL